MDTLLSDKVERLDNIADCIDVRIARLHVLIHAHCPLHAQLQTRRSGQVALGDHADA